MSPESGGIHLVSSHQEKDCESDDRRVCCVLRAALLPNVIEKLVIFKDSNSEKRMKQKITAEANQRPNKSAQPFSSPSMFRHV